MNTFTHTRALVLGGGGAAGNAWLVGVVAGLADGGLDVGSADLVIGTSAGATAAAQLAGATPAELYAAIQSAPPTSSRGPLPSGGPISGGHLEATAAIIAESSDPADMRRRMGARAIELAEAGGEEGQEHWRETVAARFTPHEWPQHDLGLTVVNAETGEPLVLDRVSGAGLVDAVAASTAGGPAFRIRGTWYIDGGYGNNADNAVAASGAERVLVLSPFGGRTRLPLEWGLSLAHEIAELRSGGSRVETIFPDAAAVDAFGPNMMDLSVRAAAARAGFAQGSAEAGRLREFWA